METPLPVPAGDRQGRIDPLIESMVAFIRDVHILAQVQGPESAPAQRLKALDDLADSDLPEAFRIAEALRVFDRRLGAGILAAQHASLLRTRLVVGANTDRRRSLAEHFEHFSEELLTATRSLGDRAGQLLRGLGEHVDHEVEQSREDLRAFGRWAASAVLDRLLRPSLPHAGGSPVRLGTAGGSTPAVEVELNGALECLPKGADLSRWDVLTPLRIAAAPENRRGGRIEGVFTCQIPVPTDPLPVMGIYASAPESWGKPYSLLGVVRVVISIEEDPAEAEPYPKNAPHGQPTCWLRADFQRDLPEQRSDEVDLELRDWSFALFCRDTKR
jgi:hypothetical protein